MSTMRESNAPFVLRDCPVTKQIDSEKYYHRLLFLYFPWRNEDELENMPLFKTKFESVFSCIEANILKYEPYLQEVLAASEICETLETSEEMWDQILPQVEQDRDQPVETDEDYQLLDTCNLSSDQLNQDTNETNVISDPAKKRALTTNIDIEPKKKYTSMVRSLNKEQRDIHQHIFNWCRKMSLASSKEVEPNPFYIFLSGGAGVGKSHCIHTIYKSAVRTLKKARHNTDLPTVLLTVPTGKAAVNIGGTTLHNAFHLPVKQKGSQFVYRHPGSSTLNTMRATYC